MKCEQCVEEGIKSRVTGGRGSKTLMYYAPYYDEEGVYHHHDGNTNTCAYTCSNGHAFVIKMVDQCPSCDYGKEIISYERV